MAVSAWPLKTAFQLQQNVVAEAHVKRSHGKDDVGQATTSSLMPSEGKGS